MAKLREERALAALKKKNLSEQQKKNMLSTVEFWKGAGATHGKAKKKKARKPRKVPEKEYHWLYTLYKKEDYMHKEVRRFPILPSEKVEDHYSAMDLSHHR